MSLSLGVCPYLMTFYPSSLILYNRCNISGFMLYWMIFYLSLFDLGAFFRLLGSGRHSKFALLMVVKSFFNDLADAPCLTFAS